MLPAIDQPPSSYHHQVPQDIFKIHQHHGHGHGSHDEHDEYQHSLHPQHVRSSNRGKSWLRDSLLYDKNKDSAWKNIVEGAAAHARGWLDRFEKTAGDCKESMNNPQSFSPSEKNSLEEFSQSMENPIKYHIPHVEKLHEYPNKTTPSMRTCFFCHHPVATGANCIHCQYCSITSHKTCLHKETRHLGFLQTNTVVETLPRESFSFMLANTSSTSAKSQKLLLQKSHNFVPFAHANDAEDEYLIHSGKYSSVSLSMDSYSSKDPWSGPETNYQLNKSHRKSPQEYSLQELLKLKNIFWTCQMCYVDYQQDNYFHHIKHQQKVLEYKQSSTIVKLQAFIRMSIHNRKFLKLRKGIIVLQRVVRVKRLTKQLEREKANQPYTFRLKFNDLKIIKLDFGYQQKLCQIFNNYNNNIIQQPPKLATFEQFVTPFPHESDAAVIGKMNNDVYEQYFHAPKLLPITVDLKDQALVNLLSQGINVEMLQNNTSQMGGSSSGMNTPRTGLLPTPTAFGMKNNATNNNNNTANNNSTSDSGTNKDGIASVDVNNVNNSSSNAATSTVNNGLNLYVKPYRDVRALPKGTIFVTVTLHEEEVNEDGETAPMADDDDEDVDLDNSDGDSEDYEQLKNYIQTYRFDMLLKEVGKATKLKSSNFEKYFKHFHFQKELLPSQIDKLSKLYSVHHFVGNKPYILIPHSHGNVVVKMTVSEVMEWPKAIVLGQCTYGPQYFIVRNKAACFQQYCSPPKSLGDLPMNEDLTKVHLMLLHDRTWVTYFQHQKKLLQLNNLTGSTANATVTTVPPIVGAIAAPVDAPIPTLLAELNAKSNQLLLDNSRRNSLDSGSTRAYSYNTLCDRYLQFQGCFVTWSLIALGNNSSYQDCGYLNIINQETSLMKKKYWCVLMDRNLFVYHLVKGGNIQNKYELDIKNSYISNPEGFVVRIKCNTEVLFLEAANKKEFQKWFRKLYTQSISHQSIPYQVYMKRKVTKPSTANGGNNNSGTNNSNNTLNNANPIMRTSSGAVLSSGAGGTGSLEIQTGFPGASSYPSTPLAGHGFTPLAASVSSRPFTAEHAASSSSPMASQKFRRNAVTRDALTPQALLSSSHSFNAGTASFGTMMTVVGGMSTPSKRAASTTSTGTSTATRANRLGSISLNAQEINRTLTSDSYADRLDILTSEVENMLAEMQHKKQPDSPQGASNNEWQGDVAEGRKSASMISRGAPKQRKRQNSLMDALQSSVVHGKGFF